MADVTGNLGSESIRLRGMALEATQEAILKELEDQTTALEAIAGGKSAAKNKENVIQDARNAKTKESTEREAKKIIELGKSNKALAALTTVFDKAGKLVSSVTGAMADNIRMTRGFDSNINNASYALNQMASTHKGVMRDFFRMGASTIDQLTEQADVYKRLSNIGGATGDEFSKLREQAASTGLTMQGYAQLMEENFLNLRLGGKSAKASMKELTQSTVNMRNAGGDFNNQFLQLGIDAQDYGKMILQNSMLMGGLNKAQKDSANYAGGFNQKMLDTTKSITALSDAFGFNREQTMKAANDALKNGRNRAMYNNIQAEGKEQMLTLMTGMFGGDAQKGLEATIAAYTGRFTQFTGTLASVAPDFLGNMKTLASELAKSPKDLKGALERSGLGPMFARLSKQQRGLVESTWNQTGALGEVVDAIVNATDMFNDTDSALQRMQERITGGVDKQLDAYGHLTRENIKMAILAARTNEGLNNFGIGLAVMAQLMALTMSTVVGSGIKGLSNNKEIQDLLEKLQQGARAGQASVESWKLEDKAGGFVDRVMKEINDRTGGGSDSGVTDARPARVYGGNRDITVQGRKTTVDSMFNIGAEATGGGTTALAVKQLVGLLADTDPGINVTATNDQRKDRTSTHATGRALDFTVQGLRDPKKFPQDAKAWKDKADEVEKLLKSKGLTPGEHFTVLDEANKPIPGVTTGPHIHVNFTPSGMKLFEGKMKNSPLGDYGSGGPLPATTAQNLTKSTETANVSPTGSLDGGTVYSAADAESAGVNIGNGNASITLVSLDQDSINAIVNGIGKYHKDASNVMENAEYMTRKTLLAGTYPILQKS